MSINSSPIWIWMIYRRQGCVIWIIGNLKMDITYLFIISTAITLHTLHIIMCNDDMEWHGAKALIQ